MGNTREEKTASDAVMKRLQTENESLRTENLSLKAEVESLRSELSSASATIRDQEIQLLDTTKRATVNCHDLEDQVEKLKAELDQVKKERDQLKARVRSMTLEKLGMGNSSEKMKKLNYLELARRLGASNADPLEVLDPSDLKREFWDAYIKAGGKIVPPEWVSIIFDGNKQKKTHNETSCETDSVDANEANGESGPENETDPSLTDPAGGHDSDPDPARENEETKEPSEEAKKRGNKNLQEFLHIRRDYFDGKMPMCFRLDDGYLSLDDLIKRFGSVEKAIYIASEVQLYNVIKIIETRIFPVTCVSLKFRQGDATVRTPHEGSLFRDSMCSSGMLAYLVYQKLAMGLSWCVIEKDLHAMGFNIKRQTFVNWVNKISSHLGIVVDYLLNKIKSCDVVMCDETYAKTMLDTGVHQAFLWQFRTCSTDSDIEHPIVAFVFDRSRSALVPQYWLHGYEGYVMSDGYSSYKTFRSRNDGIIRAVCYVHGRRPLFKAVKDFGKDLIELVELDEKALTDASLLDFWEWKALTLLQNLFQIESELKDLSAEERLEKRKERMTDCLNTLFALLDNVAEKGKENPSLLANANSREALSYFLNNREDLYRILESGKIPLSTNEVENGMIRVALARNRWKLIQSEKGGAAIAACMTLVELAKSNGVNVLMYLQYVFETLARLEDRCQKVFLDWTWLDTRKRNRLEEARKRREERPNEDPKLDLSGLPKGPDLSFLECLMPWSDEFQNYTQKTLARQKKEMEGFARVMNKVEVEDSRLTPETLERIREWTSRQDDELFQSFSIELGEVLAEVGKEDRPETAHMEGPVKGMVFEQNDADKDGTGNGDQEHPASEEKSEENTDEGETDENECSDHTESDDPGTDQGPEDPFPDADGTKEADSFRMPVPKPQSEDSGEAMPGSRAPAEPVQTFSPVPGGASAENGLETVFDQMGDPRSAQTMPTVSEDLSDVVESFCADTFKGEVRPEDADDESDGSEGSAFARTDQFRPVSADVQGEVCPLEDQNQTDTQESGVEASAESMASSEPCQSSASIAEQDPAADETYDMHGPVEGSSQPVMADPGNLSASEGSVCSFESQGEVCPPEDQGQADASAESMASSEPYQSSASIAEQDPAADETYDMRGPGEGSPQPVMADPGDLSAPEGSGCSVESQGEVCPPEGQGQADASGSRGDALFGGGAMSDPEKVYACMPVRDEALDPPFFFGSPTAQSSASASRADSLDGSEMARGELRPSGDGSNTDSREERPGSSDPASGSVPCEEGAPPGPS